MSDPEASTTINKTSSFFFNVNFHWVDRFRLFVVATASPETAATPFAQHKESKS
jgi:hypothetical protein